MLSELLADSERYRSSRRAPAVLAMLKNGATKPGFQLVIMLRLQRALGRIPAVGGVLSSVLGYFIFFLFHCDIHRKAKLGRGLYLPHPLAIVIGENAVVGEGVTILHGVTIGRRKQADPRDPIIGDHTFIGCNAIIIGGIEIGSNVQIGAGAIVTKSIPNFGMALGSASIIKEES